MAGICFPRALAHTTGRHQQHEITRTGQLVGSALNSVQGKELPWLAGYMPGKFILNDPHEAFLLKGILTDVQEPKTAAFEPNGTCLLGQGSHHPRQRCFADVFTEGQDMETVAYPAIPQPKQDLL